MFWVWVNYELDMDEIAIITDHEDSQLYYVDNLGVRLWLNYFLTEQEAKTLMEICRKG